MHALSTSTMTGAKLVGKRNTKSPIWTHFSHSNQSLQAFFFYHRESLLATDVLRDTIQTPGSTIDVMCSGSLQSQMTENLRILHQVVHAVLFLCKQGLALRGDLENLSTTKNPSNCLALLRMFAETDNILNNPQKP